MEAEEGAHSLALSAAVNRFLNLVCHAGMHMFNLSKYYDVGEQLAIPNWIVDVRHAASHSQMPNYQVLKSAAAFCYKWLLINYWHFEAMNSTVDDMQDMKTYHNYEYIHQLLDSYKYLRIFAIWGFKNLDEIADQEEIYQQLYDFIMGLKRSQSEPKKKKKKPNTDIININDNVVYLRNQIEKMIKQGYHLDVESILNTLVNDQLLIPDQDMYNALLEGTDPNLPQNLIKVWSDILYMLSQAGFLPQLMTKLVEMKIDKNQANAWLSKILEQLNSTSKKKELKINIEDSEWNEFVENYILSCDPSLKQNLHIIGQLAKPCLTKDRISKLQKLIEIFEDTEPMNEDFEIKSVEDLFKKKQENPGSKWKLENAVDWTQIPFGQCPNSNLNFEDKEALNRCPEWLEDINEEVVELDWYYLMNRNFETMSSVLNYQNAK